MNPQFRYARSLLFLISIILIAALGAYMRQTAVDRTIIENPIRADAAEYYVSAYNLVHHGIYSRSLARLRNPSGVLMPDSFRYPGLPLVIATFMGDWPNHMLIYRRMLTVNVVVGVLSCVLTVLAAAAVLPLAAALAVGALTALSPHLVSIATYMLTEPIAVGIVSALLAFCAIGLPRTDRGKSLFFAGMGIIVGVLTLFRPIYLGLAPVLALVCTTRRDMGRAVAYLVLGAAIVLAPWFVRNALNVRAGGDQQSLLAATLVDGAYRGYTFNGDRSVFPWPRLVDPIFRTASSDVVSALREVWRRFLADPTGLAIWYLIEKPPFLWQWSNIDGLGDVFVYRVMATPFQTDQLFVAVHRIYYYSHPVVILLAAVGAVATWIPAMTARVPADKLPILKAASLIFIYTNFAHFPLFVATRYAVPVFPICYFLGVTAIVLVVPALTGRVRQPRIAA